MRRKSFALHAQKLDMLNGSIWNKLPQFALPVAATAILEQLFNASDVAVVGNFTGAEKTAAVAAVGANSPIIGLIVNLFIGIALGANVVIAHAAGQGDRDSIQKAVHTSVLVALLGGAAVAVLGELAAAPLLGLLNVPEDVFPLALLYLRIYLLGMPVILLYNFEAAIFRSMGETRTPLLALTASGILNVILNLFFVAVLHMTVNGVAIATVLSNAVSSVILYRRLRLSTLDIHLDPKRLRIDRESLGRILRIGLPSAVQFLLTLVAVGALTKFMSLYDTAAVAALGIVKKLDMLPLYFSIGVANGLLPLLAYNYSAENHERRHRIFLCGCAVAVGFSVVCVAGYEVFAPALVRIFIGDAQTIAYGTKLLRIMVLAMPMMSVCYPMITQFQAMGRMRESLICSILRKGSLDIPLLFVLNALFPLYGCAAVQPIVDCICMIVAIYFYKKLPTA